MLATFAFMLACGAAFAEESPGIRSHVWSSGARKHDGLWDDGPGRYYGWQRHDAARAAMRIIFALMDGDGDGTVSLQEFQAANEKIFKAMDTDKDGTVSIR